MTHVRVGVRSFLFRQPAKEQWNFRERLQSEVREIETHVLGSASSVQQVICTILEPSRLLLPYCCHVSSHTNRKPHFFLLFAGFSLARSAGLEPATF